MVLKNLQNSQGRTCVLVSLKIKLHSNTLFCEFYEVFNTYSLKHFRVTALVRALNCVSICVAILLCFK